MNASKLSPLRVVQSGLCIGCGGCVAQADSKTAQMTMDRYGQLRPGGEKAWLQKPSEILGRTCPFSPSAANEDLLAEELFPSAHRGPTAGRILSAFVGHVRTGNFRMNGSSGGMVSWAIDELLRKNLVDGVAHVVPIEDPQEHGGFFRYRISRTPNEVSEGAKSRYYPVEMSEVLREIRSVPGRYAVVGVPCFIKAIQLLRREDPVFRERIIYTFGLFCGHMKSARFVESFAMQMGVPLAEVAAVEFRHKDPNRPATTYTAQLTLKDGTVHRRDWWNLVDGDWGSGFFQYEACSFCDDVIGETADISFGDAWVEPYSSDGRGTNVVVVRSPELDALVRDAIIDGRLCMDTVDEGFIVETQAAGFRQRREGLAYRLTWRKSAIHAKKRLTPHKPNSQRRRLIYWSRALISHWSHRSFWLSRRTGWPGIFLVWARASVAFYHGVAYSRGRIGKLLDHILLR